MKASDDVRRLVLIAAILKFREVFTVLMLHRSIKSPQEIRT